MRANQRICVAGQGSDGNVKYFTLQPIALSVSTFPRAHTCFNRIELPRYESRADCEKYFRLALELESVGFGDQ